MKALSPSSKRSSIRPRRWQGNPDALGGRASVRVGRCTDTEYVLLREHLKGLEGAKRKGMALPASTAAWLGSIGDDLHERIERAGLCLPRLGRAASDATLATFVRTYINNRSDLGIRSINNLVQSEKRLVEVFGTERKLNTITAGDAKDFQRRLLTDRYSQATVAMFIKKAKQFFADAVDRDLIAKNPFRKVKAGSQVNTERMEYVPVEAVQSVMVVCDIKWKLRFALARYAGLRSPSEACLLEWKDVRWKDNKICVHSPKTKKHGKPLRWVPISDALRVILLEALHQAEPDDARICPGIDASTNLREQGERLCERAGVKPWQKMFQNLRLSCETDWMDSHGLTTACKFSGNTPEVAIKHYHVVRERDYIDAGRPVRASEEIRTLAGGAESGAELSGFVRKPAERNGSHKATSDAITATCNVTHFGASSYLTDTIPPRGVEPLFNG